MTPAPQARNIISAALFLGILLLPALAVAQSKCGGTCYDPPFFVRHPYWIKVFLAAITTASAYGVYRKLKPLAPKRREWFIVAFVLGCLAVWITFLHHGLKTWQLLVSGQRTGAERGLSSGAHGLGALYLNGYHRVGQDYEEAYFWLTLASKAYNQEFAHDGLREQAADHLTSDQIAAIHKRIEQWKPAPTPRDPLMHYKSPADLGDRRAQAAMGQSYEERVGPAGVVEYAKAAEWHRKAAIQGESSSQFFLGRLYSKGLGVNQDYAEALFWLILSSGAPHLESMQSARNLSAEQIVIVQKRLREWSVENERLFEQHAPDKKLIRLPDFKTLNKRFQVLLCKVYGCDDQQDPPDEWSVEYLCTSYVALCSPPP